MCQYYLHQYACKHETYAFGRFCSRASLVQTPCPTVDPRRDIWQRLRLAAEDCTECAMPPDRLPAAAGPAAGLDDLPLPPPPPQQLQRHQDWLHHLQMQQLQRYREMQLQHQQQRELERARDLERDPKDARRASESSTTSTTSNSSGGSRSSGQKRPVRAVRLGKTVRSRK